LRFSIRTVWHFAAGLRSSAQGSQVETLTETVSYSSHADLILFSALKVLLIVDPTSLTCHYLAQLPFLATLDPASGPTVRPSERLGVRQKGPFLQSLFVHPLLLLLLLLPYFISPTVVSQSD
jgi:hypothetical protein